MQDNPGINKRLGLKKKGVELMNDGSYEEAVRVFTMIIDEMQAIGPTYKYHRAKCYFQLGKDYIDQTRDDLHKVMEYTMGKSKKDAFVLRVKAIHLSAMAEIHYGQDTLRALASFEEVLFGIKTFFLQGLKKYEVPRFQRENPEIVKMVKTSEEYLE